VKNTTTTIFFVFAILTCVTISCRKDKADKKYKTQNVIVVVIDGPRFSEHQYIPYLSGPMAKEGVVYSSFRNNGPTYTSSGHTAILTGVYQDINNGGGENPKNPNYLQIFRKKYRVDSSKCRIIASKDKIEALGNTESFGWKGKYLPSYDCGNSGLGTGYRHDSLTYNHILEYLENGLPNLLLINFREPDWSGHQNNWGNYLEGIRQTDEYAYGIWQFIRTNPFYKDRTTLFVTNDHGRHLNDVSSGFRSHGDDCEGCRHINLYAYGPDFKKDIVCSAVRELIDIPTTISELLSLNMPKSDGSVMWELLAE